MNNRLAAKVTAQNQANRTVLEIYPKLRAIFEPLVGQKILKADGNLLAKIASQLPPLPHTTAVHTFREMSNYSITWKVTASHPIDSTTCDYASANCHVGDVDNGVLKSLGNPPELRTDYTVNEIEHKREVYQNARRAADDAKSALYPFGEFDR